MGALFRLLGLPIMVTIVFYERNVSVLVKSRCTSGLPYSGSVVKNPPADAGDMSSIPALGRFHVPWSN